MVRLLALLTAFAAGMGTAAAQQPQQLQPPTQQPQQLQPPTQQPQQLQPPAQQPQQQLQPPTQQPRPPNPPQQPQQPQPRVDNPPTLRAIPDGPGKRVAELQGLDKVTARTQRFYAPVGETTRFGTLGITVGDCLVNTPDAPPEAAAYLTIVDHKPGQPEQKLFAGWMFASTPALSAMDDGVYDVRVLACTMTQGSSAPK